MFSSSNANGVLQKVYDEIMEWYSENEHKIMSINTPYNNQLIPAIEQKNF